MEKECKRSCRVHKKQLKFLKLQKKVLNSRSFKKYGMPEWTLPMPCKGTSGSLGHKTSKNHQAERSNE